MREISMCIISASMKNEPENHRFMVKINTSLKLMN